MQTREKILTTFWDLYTDRPLEEISVAQITTLAGIHRSTFYHHFQDRYEVLETIENQLLDDLEPLVMDMSYTNLEDKFRKLYLYFKRNGDYLRHLVGMQRDPNFANRLRKMLGLVLDHFCQEMFLDLTPTQKSAVTCTAGGIWMSFLMSAGCCDLSEDKAIALMMELIRRGWLPSLVKIFGLKINPEIPDRYLKQEDSR